MRVPAQEPPGAIFPLSLISSGQKPNWRGQIPRASGATDLHRETRELTVSWPFLPQFNFSGCLEPPVFYCLWSLAGAPEAALQFLLQPGLKELLTSSCLFIQPQHLDIITNYLFLEGFLFFFFCMKGLMCSHPSSQPKDRAGAGCSHPLCDLSGILNPCSPGRDRETLPEPPHARAV